MKSKSGNSFIKTLVFYVLALAGIVGALMFLNGPVGYKADDEISRLTFSYIVDGAEGLNLGILGSVGKINGTPLPMIAFIAGIAGVVFAFGSFLFAKKSKVNVLTVIFAIVAVVGGVLMLFAPSAFVGVNDFGDNAAKYVLTKYGIISGALTIVSGLGFGFLEFVF